MSTLTLARSPVRLESDIDAMRAFANAVYGNSPPSYVPLRSFSHADGRVVGSQWVPLGRRFVPAAAEEATRVANLPGGAVFCPPLVGFKDQLDEHGRRRARESDILFAPVLSVELDDRPEQSLTMLETILGGPTVIVRSGGQWQAPEGRLEDKLHAHWVLTEPAQGPVALHHLKLARRMAAAIVGADRTAVPLAHPMRWPGTWHTKDPKNPRLATAETHAERKIALDPSIRNLEAAADLYGIDVDPIRLAARRGGWKTPVELTPDQLMALARAVSNLPGTPWSDWNTIGMAFHDASHSSEAGREAFHMWSEKNPDKYDPDETDPRWDHYASYPASDLSAGSLIHRAREAVPGFVLPGQRPVASSAYWFATPEEDEAAPEGEELPEHIARLNRMHAFVMNGGSALVANEMPDGGVTFSTRAAFVDRYANDTVQDGRRSLSIAEAWWRHARRRQYLGGIDFAPDGAGPGVYNLWRGFALEPNAGRSCRLFLAHLRDNVCSGDDGHFRWVCGWLAHIVQRPGEKLGVALVLRGGQGVGKTIVGDYFGQILGRHHVIVSQAEHLTGRFNAHLSTALLVQAEEAFWAGDRQAAGGALKDLVTSSRMRIERKGVDTIEVRNNIRLLVTTNSRWAVPAGLEERRFAVFDVGNAQQQNKPYFGAIHRELEDGGAAGLLHELQAFDLDSVDLRTIPQTGALLDQKVESFEPHARWWFDSLKRGSIGLYGGWPEVIGRQELLADYEKTADKLRARPLTQQAFGRELRTFCPSIGDRRPRPEAMGESRKRLYVLPDLATCRAEFELAVRAPVDWEDA